MYMDVSRLIVIIDVIDTASVVVVVVVVVVVIGPKDITRPRPHIAHGDSLCSSCNKSSQHGLWYKSQW